MAKDKVPRARRLIRLVIEDLEQKGDTRNVRILKRALPLMRRKKAVSRGKVEHQKMTVAIGRKIRAYAKKHKKLRLTQKQIGDHFNVDKGRVSEALNGEWT